MALACGASYQIDTGTGNLVCNTQIVNRGKTVANLESRIYLEKVLVAQANGNYAIFRPRRAEA